MSLFGWFKRDPIPSRRAPIASPCVNICTLHPSGPICIGCKRTAAEIAQWEELTAAKRAEILAKLPARELPITT